MTDIQFRTRTEHVHGVRWFVRESTTPPRTSAPPLVMIAGLGEGDYLLPHARRLAPDMRVLVPDMPGFGRSRAPQRLDSVDAYAAALTDWIAACVGKPVNLVGSSFGCQIAVAATQHCPDLASRLVLNGPTFDAAARTIPGQLSRWLATMWREPPMLGPMLIRSYVRSGFRTPIAGFRMGLADRIEDRLADIHQPVLIVRGQRDRIVSAEWVTQLCRRGEHVEVAVVPAAHTVDYGAPDELAAVTRPFLLATADPPAP
jgi:pimeloyl-ACP methyl ester carboxylesterase